MAHALPIITVHKCIGRFIPGIRTVQSQIFPFRFKFFPHSILVAQSYLFDIDGDRFPLRRIIDPQAPADEFRLCRIGVIQTAEAKCFRIKIQIAEKPVFLMLGNEPGPRGIPAGADFHADFSAVFQRDTFDHRTEFYTGLCGSVIR